jgi:hypothetical protein
VRSRFPSTRASLLVVLLAGLVLAGCGGLRQVTYVDPNGPSGANADGSSAEPVARFGAAAAVRAEAVVHIRAALAAARTLASTDVTAAHDVVGRTITDDLPTIEPRVVAARPALATALRGGLERLRDHPPANVVGYTREVRRLSDTLLVQAGDIAVPAAARQDIGFRAAVLHDTLQQASTSYEASFSGGTDKVASVPDYRIAYGLLIDAATRQLEAVPDDARPALRSQLDQITRRTTPGPTPPSDPRNPETVISELGTLSDDVAAAAHIDPTFPEPDTTTPDDLRTLKRSVATAVATWQQGDHAGALTQLATADRTSLASASAGLAAVSPGLLADVERGLVIDLPTAMRTNADVADAGVALDTDIDEAIQLVEEELQLLRDAG